MGPQKTLKLYNYLKNYHLGTMLSGDCYHPILVYYLSIHYCNILLEMFCYLSIKTVIVDLCQKKMPLMVFVTYISSNVHGHIVCVRFTEESKVEL